METPQLTVGVNEMNFLHEGRALHVPHENILLRASKFLYLNDKQKRHFLDNKCSIDLIRLSSSAMKNQIFRSKI